MSMNRKPVLSSAIVVLTCIALVIAIWGIVQSDEMTRLGTVAVVLMVAALIANLVQAWKWIRADIRDFRRENGSSDERKVSSEKPF